MKYLCIKDKTSPWSGVLGVEITICKKDSLYDIEEELIMKVGEFAGQKMGYFSVCGYLLDSDDIEEYFVPLSKHREDKINELLDGL